MEVIDFYGRLTERRAADTASVQRETHAGAAVPVVAIDSGLKGIVTLTVNGEHIDDFVFVETSKYP